MQSKNLGTQYILFFLLVILFGCQRDLRDHLSLATIEVDRRNPTLAYAAMELRVFLEATGEIDVVDRPSGPVDWTFTLAVDSAMTPSTFAVATEGTAVRLAGHDAAGALHAVYTALELAGYTFDVTGPVIPRRLDLDALRKAHVVIRPAVQRRGIRQHINFPMDISSYALSDAREYIRNLARLRMNHITFHSYLTQWYAYRKKEGSEILAGNFFYGERFDIPDHPAIRGEVHNARTYAIPEIEPLYDKPVERSRAAIAWLREVIRQAKLAGMSVWFSMEPRGESLEDGLAAWRSILESYPEIDGMELITQERGGGSGQGFASGEIRKMIAEQFGAAVSDDAAVAGSVIDGTTQIDGALRELAGSIRLAGALRDGGIVGNRSLAVGVYVTDPRALATLLPVMRKTVPEEIFLSFLPSYGARGVARAVERAKFTAADWRRTMMASWMEFDGNIYLQQHNTAAIARLIDLARAELGEEQIPGICFNHWRTAENRTTIRYAATAAIDGPAPADDFHRDYARRLGLGEGKEAYVEAMRRLDEVNGRVERELSGIGFCFAGSWTKRPGMLWIRNWKPENLIAIRDEFNAIAALLATVSGGATAEGREHIDFLVNRIGCSAIHLEAVGNLIALTPLCDDAAPEKLGEEGRKEVIRRCDAASRLVDEYLRLHARMIADRGCEGMLLSYHAVLPAFIRKVRTVFGGAPDPAQPVPQGGRDAPPAPRPE